MQRTARLCRLYLRVLARPHPRRPLASLLRRREAPTGILLLCLPVEERWFPKVPEALVQCSKCACVLLCWVCVYKSELSGLQCCRSETRTSSTPTLLRPKARRLNSTVTRRPAKSPCMMNQRERAARWGPSGTRTCSERPSRTGQQIRERTASRSSILKDSHHSTSRRRTRYLRGFSRRPRTSLPRRGIT